MDLMSKRSPSASVSPPISPIKLFNQPVSSLPPLKNLPVWNRTGLEKNRFIRSITKDSPELGKAELLLGHLSSKSTQTSPPGTAFNGRTFQSGNGLDFSSKNEIQFRGSSVAAEKRLFFVQTEHEHVLKKLHGEIDKLKHENKDLTFKLVMTKNGISISQEGGTSTNIRNGSSKSLRHSLTSREKSAESKEHYEDRKKGSSAKPANKDHKFRFRSGGARRPIQKDISDQEAKTECKSAKHVTTQLIQDDMCSQDKKLAHHSFFQSEAPLISENAAESTLTNSDYDKKYTSDDYEQIIKGLQKLNARQANELCQLRDKLMEQKNKSEFEDLRIYPDNHLPKLATRNPSKSAKAPTVTRKKQEIVTLPALRHHRVGNSNRQRKAQSTQRQKLAKEYVQKLV